MERGRFKWNPETNSIERVSEAPRYDPVAPAVRQDTIDVYDHALGKRFDSRSARKRALEASGFVDCEGSRPQTTKTYDKEKHEQEVRADMERAYYMARDGMAPLTERERERAREADRELKKKWSR